MGVFQPQFLLQPVSDILYPQTELTEVFSPSTVVIVDRNST